MDTENNWLSVEVDAATMARIDVAKRITNAKRADYLGQALMEALDRDAPEGQGPLGIITGEDVKKIMGILSGFKGQFMQLSERLDAIEAKRAAPADRG